MDTEQQHEAGASGQANSTAAEAKFRGLLESAPDAIVIVDQQARIMLANRQAEMVFGYRREDLIGQPIEGLIPERFRAGHVQQRNAYAANPHTRPMGAGLALFGRRRDGSEFPVEVSLSPLQTDEGLLITSIIRDVTARKQADDELQQAKEEAERANRAKSEFLSRMSHELRTPLNAILGFAQLLELDPLPPAEQGRIQRILKAGRHLLDLINEVLDIARVETGQLQLSLEPVRVSEVVHETVDLIRPLAEERRIALQVPADTTADKRYVFADRQRVKQVLLNLLSNATKYNHVGGTVTLATEAAEAGLLRISVRDTGPGIPQEKLPRLFSPFDRLDAESSEVEGTGLGLAITKGLTQAMGGQIGVESRIGDGSTFWVELALAEHPVQELPQEKEPLAGVEIPTERHVVLYIEDNLSNVELIEQILARWPDINLLAAIQGQLGIDLARKHHPDLILLDLHLPDLPGIEVLRLLREDPATRSIPIVVLSADATPRQIDRLQGAGARAYLTKPLDVPRFLALVREVLEEEASR